MLVREEGKSSERRVLKRELGNQICPNAIVNGHAMIALTSPPYHTFSSCNCLPLHVVPALKVRVSLGPASAFPAKIWCPAGQYWVKYMQYQLYAPC